MKKIIIILVILLAGMEGLGWLAYKKFSKPEVPAVENLASQQTAQSQPSTQNDSDIKSKILSGEKKASNADIVPGADDASTSSVQAQLGANITKFPYVIMEKQGDLTMRTIHMGVRQWAWDPMSLTVNYGEKVNLIIHNADVAHSISIPELNVKAEISEDGAIVTFMASKKGTFEYFCYTPCGKGHSQMRGKITVT